MESATLPSSTFVNLWTDDFLNQMRLTGDPLADATAAEMFKDQKNTGVLMASLREVVTNASADQRNLPEFLSHYFDTAIEFPEGFTPDVAKINLACKVFDSYGFHIITILFFKSLPAGYLAPYPSKVLATTHLMETQVARRVLQTAQMIFDVHKTNWYQNDGDGIVSVLKVRLMHAGMRVGILQRLDKEAWDINDDWLKIGIPQGKPINQEDMVLTLNLFSIIILRGLERLGVELNEEEKDAYFYNWQLVGHFAGIHKDLLPTKKEDAWTLQNKMCGRLNKMPNDYGPGLTLALLDVINKNTKGIISLKLLENMTLYLLEDPNAQASLGFGKPSFFDVLLDKILTAITARAQKRIDRNETIGQNLEKKNSTLGLIFFIYAKRAHLEGIKIEKFKMALFQKISLVIMKGLQENAVATNNTKPFIDDRLMQLWDIGGFSWDQDTEGISKTALAAQRSGGYLMMVVSPLVSGGAFYEFYRVRIEHLPAFHTFLDGMTPTDPAKLQIFNEHHVWEMLCVGLIFLATSAIVYISMLVKSKFKYLRAAYVLLMVALLAWLLYLE